MPKNRWKILARFVLAMVFACALNGASALAEIETKTVAESEGLLRPPADTKPSAPKPAETKISETKPVEAKSSEAPSSDAEVKAESDEAPISVPGKVEEKTAKEAPLLLPKPAAEKATEKAAEKAAETAPKPAVEKAVDVSSSDGAAAKKTGKKPLPASQSETLRQVEQYLQQLTTIVADFSQVAPDGSLSSGKFYLSRPGKMRWQYNPPTPILMIASGDNLIFYDYELEQLSNIPLDETLAGFLAKNTIRFTDPAITVEFVETLPALIRVGIVQTAKPKQGKLVLEFTDAPLTLKNMQVTDAAGQVTNVSLSNAAYGVKIDAELFNFRDPRKPKGAR